MTQQAVGNDIDAVVAAFFEAVYPGNAELAMASFNEKKVLADATKLISELLEALRDLVERRGHPGDRLDRAHAAIALATPDKDGTP